MHNQTITSEHQDNFALKLINTLQNIMALITIAWMSGGLFSYIIPYFPNFLRYDVFAAWLLLATIRKKGYLTRLIRYTCPLILT